MLLVLRSAADVQALIGRHPATGEARSYLNERVEKPWGWEEQVYADSHISLTRLMMKPGMATSLHCHIGKTALMSVEDGGATVETLQGSHDIGAHGIVTLQPGAFHRIKAGAQGATVWEIESPGNKGDIVRLADDHGRVGRGYEGS